MLREEMFASPIAEWQALAWLIQICCAVKQASGTPVARSTASTRSRSTAWSDQRGSATSVVIGSCARSVRGNSKPLSLKHPGCESEAKPWRPGTIEDFVRKKLGPQVLLAQHLALARAHPSAEAWEATDSDHGGGLGVRTLGLRVLTHIWRDIGSLVCSRPFGQACPCFTAWGTCGVFVSHYTA